MSKAVHVVALIASTAALSACGSDTTEPETSDAVNWANADACSLSDPATLAPLLTVDAGAGTPTEDADRKACTWGQASQLNTVTITLTAEPLSSEPLRTLEVGGLTGRVLAESKYQCILEFETSSGTMSLESKFGLDATVNPDTSCDRSVPLAEHALTQLHWS